MRRAFLALVVALAATGAAPADAAPTVGSSFPADFPVFDDASLGKPIIGFGSKEGGVTRTPVVFLHGNNDTPYPTSCNGSYGKVQAFAQFFVDQGYTPAEVWALGYQGDQCDLLTDQRKRAGEAHTTVANVADVRRFVRAVLAYTGARQVDIVGHSLGGTLAREWMREDGAYDVVRRLVMVDSPNHGILNCSPSPLNYYATLGFVPDAPVCLEYGAADTPFLRRLNSGDPTPGPTEYLAVFNVDASFVYLPVQDGALPPVPAQDRTGKPHDFSRSAALEGATLLEVRGQGPHDETLRTAHYGINDSPEVRKATFAFLSAGATAAPTSADPTAAPAPAPAAAPRRELPATGDRSGISGAIVALVAGLWLRAATRDWGGDPGRPRRRRRQPAREAAVRGPVAHRRQR